MSDAWYVTFWFCNSYPHRSKLQWPGTIFILPTYQLRYLPALKSSLAPFSSYFLFFFYFPDILTHLLVDIICISSHQLNGDITFGVMLTADTSQWNPMLSENNELLTSYTIGNLTQPKHDIMYRIKQRCVFIISQTHFKCQGTPCWKQAKYLKLKWQQRV